MKYVANIPEYRTTLLANTEYKQYLNHDHATANVIQNFMNRVNTSCLMLPLNEKPESRCAL